MKSFYESFRESTELCITTPDKSFDLHYHINLEIYLIQNGKYIMNLNNNSFPLENGSILIADSYDVHGYTRVSENEDTSSKIIVIPYKYLSYYNSIKGERKIKNCHIIDKALCQKLIEFIDFHISQSSSEDAKKFAINYFLSLICDRLEFSTSKNSDSASLIKKILNLIHNNYTKNISRKIIATSLGYSEEHISRVFHEFIKMGISKYVNNLRLEYVEMNKKLSDKTLNELIFEAGFNSERTYFRAKKNK